MREGGIGCSGKIKNWSQATMPVNSTWKVQPSIIGAGCEWWWWWKIKQMSTMLRKDKKLITGHDARQINLESPTFDNWRACGWWWWWKIKQMSTRHELRQINRKSPSFSSPIFVVIEKLGRKLGDNSLCLTNLPLLR